MSRKVFVLNWTMTLKDYGIEGILERTVTKQGTSAKADVPRRHLRRRVYVIVPRSKGEVGDEELSAVQESTYIRKG